MKEFSPEQLERASLLISIAPGRSYSADETEVIRKFVRRRRHAACASRARRNRGRSIRSWRNSTSGFRIRRFCRAKRFGSRNRAAACPFLREAGRRQGRYGAFFRRLECRIAGVRVGRRRSASANLPVPRMTAKSGSSFLAMSAIKGLRRRDCRHLLRRQRKSGSHAQRRRTRTSVFGSGFCRGSISPEKIRKSNGRSRECRRKGRCRADRTKDTCRRPSDPTKPHGRESGPDRRIIYEHVTFLDRRCLVGRLVDVRLGIFLSGRLCDLGRYCWRRPRFCFMERRFLCPPSARCGSPPCFCFPRRFGRRGLMRSSRFCCSSVCCCNILPIRWAMAEAVGTGNRRGGRNLVDSGVGARGLHRANRAFARTALAAAGISGRRRAAVFDRRRFRRREHRFSHDAANASLGPDLGTFLRSRQLVFPGRRDVFPRLENRRRIAAGQALAAVDSRLADFGAHRSSFGCRFERAC